MPAPQLRVENYFSYLRKYALGDLALFHQLAKDAEEIEKSGNSSTTTPETTYISTGSYAPHPPTLEDLRPPIEIINRVLSLSA